MPEAPNLYISNFQLSTGDILIANLAFDFDSSSIIDFQSSIITGKRVSSKIASIKDVFDLKSSIFNFINLANATELKDYTSNLILSICQDAIQSLAKCFSLETLSHVGPIRAYPKRYYFAGQASSEQLDSDNILELLRDNEELQLRANGWLEKFGLSVNIQKVKDIVHRMAVQQTGIQVDLDITDVGFGLSQILPVVIQAFLAPPNGISIVEQPEIHLHPSMQADLTDFFLDVCQQIESFGGGKSSTFLIETHSVSLLRRLRTRLATKKSYANSETIAIYNVEKDNGQSVARQAIIKENGNFQWPKEFLEAELKDTLEFLKQIED